MSDLINKNQSLIEWKKDFKDFVEWLDMPRDDYKGIMSYIDEVPSVEPRKKGEWLEKEVEDRPIIEQWQTARCSACNKYHTTPYMYYFDDYKFCPHCGAKMEGKHDTI